MTPAPRSSIIQSKTGGPRTLRLSRPRVSQKKASRKQQAQIKTEIAKNQKEIAKLETEIKETKSKIAANNAKVLPFVKKASVFYDKAVEAYRKSEIHGKKVATTPRYIAEAFKLKRTKEDSTQALNTLKKAAKTYADSSGIADIIKDICQYYLQSGNTIEADKYLKTAIEKDPTNPDLYFAKGNVLEKNGNIKEAVATYQKALEISPKYFNAYYNLGVIYFNKAAKILEEAGNIPPNQVKKYNAALKDAKGEFKTALPFMEKAHEIKPKDMSTMKSLSSIYLKLQMYDKQKAIKLKMDK